MQHGNPMELVIFALLIIVPLAIVAGIIGTIYLIFRAANHPKTKTAIPEKFRAGE
jgi:hypothetical protein